MAKLIQVTNAGGSSAELTLRTTGPENTAVAARAVFKSEASEQLEVDIKPKSITRPRLSIDPNHKRFQTLPKIPEAYIQELQQQEAHLAKMPHVAQMRRELRNFTTTSQVDFVTQNKVKLSAFSQEMVAKGLVDQRHRSDGENPLKASRPSVVNPAVRTLQNMRNEMRLARSKIKCIIESNPYHIKNYVRSENVNNSLLPQKLLKEKGQHFDTDEDFIEHYLREMKKEQAESLLKRTKSKTDETADPLPAQRSVSLTVGDTAKQIQRQAGESFFKDFVL